MQEHLPALPVSRIGEPWSESEDRQLYDAFAAGVGTPALASAHQRSVGGIRARLQLLGMIDSNGVVISPTPPFIAIQRKVKGGISVPKRARASRELRAIFAASTEEGWQVEVRSNVRLDDEKIERLSLMLRGAVDRPHRVR